MKPSRSDALRPIGMRRVTRRAIICILSCAALFLPLFVATAPASATTPVGYTVSSSGGTVSVSIRGGSIEKSNDSVSIKNSSGASVYTFPLAYRVDDREFPIKARTAGNTITLTPVRAASASRPVDRASVKRYRAEIDKQIRGPQTRQQRDDEAAARFGQQISLAFAIGGFVGTAIGAAIGCIVSLPLACLPGLTIGAGVGGVVGTIVAGGPTLAIAAQQYFKTINSPFKPQYY